MPSLSELQRGFAAAIVFGDRTAMRDLGIVGGSLDAAGRLAIYRNNVLASYRKALAATYPVVQALVGRAFFGAAVDAFVRAHPSRRGDINHYGGELAEFLAHYPPARELAYLSDVARLEWAIDQASIAADAGPLDLDSLAAIAPSSLGTLRFQLHPSARLIVSAYPIFSIWQAHQPGREDDPPVDLGRGGDTVLVVRGADGVSLERLSPSAYAFLALLAGGVTLDEALGRTLAADPGFDLGEALRRHVGSGTIVGLRSRASFR
jgi:hypothetical protein